MSVIIMSMIPKTTALFTLLVTVPVCFVILVVLSVVFDVVSLFQKTAYK